MVVRFPCSLAMQGFKEATMEITVCLFVCLFVSCSTECSKRGECCIYGLSPCRMASVGLMHTLTNMMVIGNTQLEMPLRWRWQLSAHAGGQDIQRQTPNTMYRSPGMYLYFRTYKLLAISISTLASSTIKTCQTFKTNHGNVPKLTKENNPVWKQKIGRVLIAKIAYNNVTIVELLPLGNSVNLPPLHASWHDQASEARARIHLGCCDKLFPLINNIDDPVWTWEALRVWLDKAWMNLGCTQVLRKLTASWPLLDEMVTHYFSKLIAFRKKLIGITEISLLTTLKYISSRPYRIHLEWPSTFLNSESPVAGHSSVWMRSANMQNERP